MGLVFTDTFAFGQISSLDVLEAIKTCISRIESNQANAAIVRWFGDVSAPYKKILKGQLDTFRKVINLQTINVGFRDLNERQTFDPNKAQKGGGTGGFVSVVDGENAAALPGSATSIVPGSTQNYKGRHVLLNEGFRSLHTFLPKTGGGLIDDTGYNQSKFETLVHELSHVILSTNDELLVNVPDQYNGNTAYGAQRAAALVAENNALAKTNAENWGIFVEACGRNKSS